MIKQFQISGKVFDNRIKMRRRGMKGIVVKENGLYTQDDIKDIDFLKDIGFPGEFPYTRGVYPAMYRTRLWTMRQFAGFGLPEDTNKRLKTLWQEGETGFSTAFDLPTLYGYDSDDPHSLGEVGKGGVAIDTLDDMARLFDGIPIANEDVSVSMTINAPACVLLAMYYALAKKQRVYVEGLRGTMQNDILKEYTAQNELIVPPDPAMKIFVDTVEFCMKYMPAWYPVSISGYHMREAGANAVQELAFTLADGMAYVSACKERGLDVDVFAPKFTFFFDVHNNFFEEIVKLRAARKMWAHIMRDRFGAKNEKSWMLRMHAQTAGVSLTRQQYKNNAIRITMQALAAILGGVQSLHTDGIDEVYSLPSEEAAKLALRTQQILAYETKITDVVDPLGGSYFIERLTKDMEDKAWEYIEYINHLGGMLEAVKKGYPRREIYEVSSPEFERRKAAKEDIIVGVNEFVEDEEFSDIGFRVNPEVGNIQVERLKKFKAKRTKRPLKKALKELETAARSGKNLMPYIIEAVEAKATEGEIVSVLKEVYGEVRGEWIRSENYKLFTG